MVLGLVLAGLLRARTAAPQRPNVIVLLWDTVRADRLSLYGHHRPTSPWLERFAADAVVYERAISPGMWTVPAHGSLFTGLPVASHGANARWIWLDGRFTSLAEHLGAHGYATWAWSSNPYLSPSTNLLQGFDTVELAWEGRYASDAAAATRAKAIDRDASAEISPAWQPGGHGHGWPRHLTATKDAGTVIHAAFVAWLAARPDDDAPFFAFLNYLEAHHPRVPTLEGRRQVLEPALLEAGLEVDASLFRTMSAMEGRAAFSEEELDALGGVYDAALWDLDHVTGALMDDLAARGLLDDTVVVLLSDHGEHLGERGMFDHRWSVDQALLHVPLVVRYPRALAANRVARPVSTQDVFGTVCALLGIESPAGVGTLETSSGPAFAELVQPTPRLQIVKEAWPDLDPRRWQSRYRVAVEGDRKLVLDSHGPRRLFDLTAVPLDAVDRVAAEPEVADGLEQAVERWVEARPPYRRADRGPGDRPRPALRPSERTREQLEMLGYVEADR